MRCSHVYEISFRLPDPLLTSPNLASHSTYTTRAVRTANGRAIFHLLIFPHSGIVSPGKKRAKKTKCAALCSHSTGLRRSNISSRPTLPLNVVPNPLLHTSYPTTATRGSKATAAARPKVSLRAHHNHSRAAIGKAIPNCLVRKVSAANTLPTHSQPSPPSPFFIPCRKKTQVSIIIATNVISVMNV